MSIEAEQAIIAAVIQDNDALDKLEDLDVADFSESVHRLIFSAMRKMRLNAEAIDEITLAAHLAGSVAVSSILDISSSASTSANVTYYSGIVARRAFETRMRKALTAAIEVVGSGESINDEIAKIESLFVNAMGRLKKDSATVHVGALVKKHCTRMTEECGKPEDTTRCVPTGFVAVDTKTGKLRRGELIILAGRPSMGKTSLALNIAVNAAKAGNKTLFFSSEMSSEAVSHKIVIAELEESQSRVEKFRGEQSAVFWNKVCALPDKAQKLQLWFNDTTSLSISTLRAIARQHKATHGLDFIAVDYLQLLVGQGQNREREVADISRGLKFLAKELDVPVLALAQLNRGVESRNDKRPAMSDLRDSGSIEQDSDIVMTIYRDAYYNTSTDDDSIVEVNVAKNRNGETGVVKIKAILDQSRFTDLS